MTIVETDITAEELKALDRLNRDLRTASMKMPAREARYIVDLYYQIQELRIRIAGQIRAAGDAAEPTNLLSWLLTNVTTLERDLKICMGLFATQYRVGAWLDSICGIGPVLSAGLLSNFDIRKAPTAGQFWRFAGLDPSVKWLGKAGAKEIVDRIVGKGKATEDHLQQIAKETTRHPENIRRLLKDKKVTRSNLLAVLAKRPYSNSVKCLCAGKVADSFVKQQGRPSDFYGAIYRAHRDKEEVTNEAGGFAEQAAAAMAAKKYGKDTASFQAYTDGKLPPLHLHNRSERYTVKLFLSHLHQVMFEDYHGKKAPLPYVFGDGTNGHRHLIEPPGWNGVAGTEGEPLKVLYGEG